MGVDITMIAERRRPDGSWERAEPLVRLGDLNSRVQGTARCTMPLRWASGAGAERAGLWAVRPAGQPGIPYDASDETRAERAAYRDDAYDDACASVADVLAFDWDQPVLQTGSCCVGLVPGGSSKAWRGVQEQPEGEGWRPIGERSVTHSGTIVQDFVRETGQTYREVCRSFLETALPELLSYGPPEDVRILMWFF